MRQFDIGAVVVLDALGFKRIWAREDPLRVLQRMKELRRKALRLQGHDRAGALLTDDGLRHRVRCMSDTFVITVIVKGPQPPRRALYRAMLSAGLIAGNIMVEAAEGTPALLFRGCLAAGELKEDIDFLIGPAIDEAAERCEQADGAFLWLAPSALNVTEMYAETFPERLEPTIMVPYAVPLNTGGRVKTQAFTYFGLTKSQDSRISGCRKVLQAFGSGKLPTAVEQKRRHTHRFMRHIDMMAESGDWMRRPFSLRRPAWHDLSHSQRKSILLRCGLHWDNPERAIEKLPTYQYQLTSSNIRLSHNR